MKRFPGILFFLILVVGIFLGFILVTAISISTSSVFTPFKTTSLDTSRGKALFRQACASCHSSDEGVIGGIGPNLHNIGQTGGQRVEGMHSQDYILQSILYPEAYQVEGAGHMPQGTVAGMPIEIVRSLVGYLSSLGGVVDTEHLQQMAIDVGELEPEPRVTSVAQLQLGWDLFYNKLGCIACHSLNGIPGGDLRAPSLGKAGLLSEEHILSSIRNPDEIIANVWRVATIETADQRVLTGRILSDDQATIALLHNSSASGSLLVREDLGRAIVERITLSDRSLMPAYTLTIRDEQALVSFLRSLVAEL